MPPPVDVRVTTTPRRWQPMQSAWWPSIADALPRPWPREAALFDLRWHSDRVACGQLERMPGRPALRERWGWSGYAVRRLVSAGAEWQSPIASASEAISPEVRQKSASSPPAKNQPIASDSSKEPRTYADLTSGKTSEKPAKNQKSASSSPAERQRPLGNVDAVGVSEPLRKKIEEEYTTTTERAGAREPQPGQLFAQPEPTPEPLSAEELQLLRILTTYSGGGTRTVPTARRWSLRWGDDRAWFQSQILASPQVEELQRLGVSVGDCLTDWSEYVETQLREAEAGRKSKYPKNWKLALRNQIRFRLDRTRRDHGRQKQERPQGRRHQARGAQASPLHEPLPGGWRGRDAGTGETIEW